MDKATPSKLKQYLNRTILASIPALFEDGRCRAYTLLSIEADGLWLSSNELAERLLPERERKDTETAQPVFVPAVQIAAIILPPPPAPTAPPVEAEATPAESGTVATGAAAKAGPPKRTRAAPAGAPSTPAGAEKPTK
jgi:hypothetical protein